MKTGPKAITKGKMKQMVKNTTTNVGVMKKAIKTGPKAITGAFTTRCTAKAIAKAKCTAK